MRPKRSSGTAGISGSSIAQPDETPYPSGLKLLEAEIQRTCEELLQWDGWKLIRLEQNFSEKKQKSVGERGAPDALLVRYGGNGAPGDILFIEWKRKGGKAAAHQTAWHTLERKRGALTLIAGEDFEASIEGFKAWYAASGLQRRVSEELAAMGAR